MIRALASEGPLPVIQLRPTDVLSKYLGESEANLRAVFARARSIPGPSILFIDNIEVLGARRGIGGDSTGSSERLLGTLLNEMDGVTSSGDVLVLGCTNRIEDLDEALLRPGRLDHHIEVTLPTEQDVMAIVRASCDRLHIQLDGGGDVHSELARRLAGRTPAAIVSILNKYALDCIDQELPLPIEPLLARAVK